VLAIRRLRRLKRRAEPAAYVDGTGVSHLIFGLTPTPGRNALSCCCPRACRIACGLPDACSYQNSECHAEYQLSRSPPLLSACPSVREYGCSPRNWPGRRRGGFLQGRSHPCGSGEAPASRRGVGYGTAGAVDGGAADAEEFGDLGGAVLAAVQQGGVVCFLSAVELGLLAAQPALGLGDLYALAGAEPDQVGFNYVDKPAVSSRFGLLVEVPRCRSRC